MKATLPSVLMALTLAGACGSMKQDQSKQQDQTAKLSENKIQEFIQEHKAPYQRDSEKAEKYLQNYENYLKDVNRIYVSTGDPEKFEDYLNLLEVQSRELQDMEKNLPKRFANETNKKKVDPKSTDYMLYKTKVMSKFYDQLNQARAEKLKGQLDQQTFTKLVENHKQYLQKMEGGQTGLYLPL